VSRRPGLPTEQRLGLLAWAALIALQPVWHAWLFPPSVMPTWLILLVTTVPLLLPLLAVRDVRRALLWVGLLSLFYFSHGVAEAWSAAGQRGLALLEVVLTVLLIALLGAGVRRRPETTTTSP
jgi:uncharacterized membrane protein